MKRRNLFLSLISSIVVAVAIVTVTVCSVIPKKKNQQNGKPGITTPIADVKDYTQYENANLYERDGSVERPYVLYSAESFVSILEEFGGIEGINFEVVENIDFAGFNYAGEANKGFVTLFNRGIPFRGNINGNGFTLSNISINVTTENLESDFSYSYAGNRYSRIAIFGEMRGSTIENLNIGKLNVNVAPEVNGFISEAKYDLSKGPFAEMVVASVAGIARNVTLTGVDIEANIAGSTYINNAVSGNNAIGGVVAVASNFEMNALVNEDNEIVKKSEINVSIETNAGSKFLVGGISAYGTNVEVSNSEISVEIKSSASRIVTLAGMFAYARTFDASDVNVNFTVKETLSQVERDSYISNLTTDSNGQECLAKASDMSTVAGLVGILRANDSTQETNITNVNVNSNIDFDGMFAGVVFDVYSSSKTTFKLVEFKNVIVTADVNALVVHGFARQLVATTVSYDIPADTTGYYNIKLTGNVRFDRYTGVINVKGLDGNIKQSTVTYNGATILSATDIKYANCSYKDLYIQASEGIDSVLQNGFNGISIRVGAFGKYTKIAG